MRGLQTESIAGNDTELVADADISANMDPSCITNTLANDSTDRNAHGTALACRR